jgi:ABC-type phosphate transport system substrate-binding protein
VISPRRVTAVVLVAAMSVVVVAFLRSPDAEAQASYQRISGEGSSWAAGFIDTMRVNVGQNYGITVDYNPSGSTAGRKNYLNGTVDFAASDIPFQFQPEDGSAPEDPEPNSYAYIPVTAGGTSFIYNLKINGQRVTNLRLSGENVARIFTGQLTNWSDPAIQQDNPGLQMPDRPIVPVVRSEGSGSTAQLTKWMIAKHGGVWQDYCQKSGRAPACGFTSQYPTIGGMIAQSGDLGVTGYVTANYAEGAIGYVNYSYAIGSAFPVVKVLNSAGYYTEPTPENVAVSLLKADINRDANSDDYLTQILDGVYNDADPRNYQLSSYSYFILPTKVKGQFNEGKGRSLAAFAYYSMCQGQQSSASLGYSPMPINLVTASFDQIKRIPGAEVQSINVESCDNPTFSPDGRNLLAENAPFPSECDKVGVLQCTVGSGGVKDVETEVLPAANGGDGGSGSDVGDGSSTRGADGADGTTDGTICDPDTGVCTTSDGSSSRRASTESAGPQTNTIAGDGGWGSAQTLAVVIGALLLALVFVPALLWRNLSGPDSGSTSR